MRFWLRRGVDGFRIDVVQLLAKRFELATLPAEVRIDMAAISDPGLSASAFWRQPWAASTAIYPIIRGLRGVADEFDDRVLVGEIWLPIRRLMRFYGRELSGLHLPFNFQLITTRWRAPAVHRVVAAYEGALPAGAWPNWVLGNHDRSRIASRVGTAQARVAAVLLLTLRGTPTLYYGDELGMTDVAVPPDAQRDPQGLRGGESRDPERTPMRWDSSPLAGFSAAQPWLPIGRDVAGVNVAAERDDPHSMLSLHRRLLELRRSESALNIGEWHDLGNTSATVAYLRSDGARRFLIAANLTGTPAPTPDGAAGLSGRVRISTVHRASGDRHAPADGLAANEALVVEVD
jgi:alpha-glucosidase